MSPELTSPPLEPYPRTDGVVAAKARSTRQPVRRIDVIVTTVELVALAGAAAVASLGALFFLSLAAASCSAADCPRQNVGAALAVGSLSPWVLLVVAVTVSVVRMALRKVAFWVPLAAAAAWVPCAVLALVALS